MNQQTGFLFPAGTFLLKDNEMRHSRKHTPASDPIDNKDKVFHLNNPCLRNKKSKCPSFSFGSEAPFGISSFGTSVPWLGIYVPKCGMPVPSFETEKERLGQTFVPHSSASSSTGRAIRKWQKNSCSPPATAGAVPKSWRAAEAARKGRQRGGLPPPDGRRSSARCHAPRLPL